MSPHILQNKHHKQSTKPGALSDRFTDTKVFQRWVEDKLLHYQKTMQGIVVEIKDPTHLTLPERSALLERLRKLNVVIYHCRNKHLSKKDLKSLCLQLGLSRLDRNLFADGDSISSIRLAKSVSKKRYIPYSDQPLGWHTDGYYNDEARKIRSFVLHCVYPAPKGGVSTFLDPEIVYLLVKNNNEDHAASLTRWDAFSVPANAVNGQEIRPEFTGPVFSADPVSGGLHMRYTARARNINWSSKTEIQQAVRYLKSVIDEASDYAITHKLEQGQGVICNNVLHKRTGFTNGETMNEQRLMYRARYYDRVLGT